MAYKCTTPCIYYREIYEQNKSPMVRLVCDYRDGVEINYLSLETRSNCRFFKSYNDIKWKL